uniref:Arrestin_N domain-containing protein n=1 Tax=Ascaris lumbricoides TaxID=6252 RepID=A0A0M3I3H7_ASCLU
MSRRRHLNAEIKLTRLAFQPGEVICGMLLVDSSNDNGISKIDVKLFGLAKVFCRDEEFPEHHYGRPVFLHNEKILIDRNAIVYQKPEPLLIEIDDAYRYNNEPLNGICPPGCHSDPSGLHAGHHGFPFEFHLPTSGLESSFTCNNCPVSIKYHIIASIMDEDGTVLMECSQPITIVKPSHASISQCQSSNVVAKCIDLKKSCSVYASMKLAKTCYKPTEPMCAVITINNRFVKFFLPCPKLILN